MSLHVPAYRRMSTPTKRGRRAGFRDVAVISPEKTSPIPTPAMKTLWH